MKTGPGLFSSFGNKSKDLLMDYFSDHKVSVSTTSVTGVTLTSGASNKHGATTGDVGAVYKSKNTSYSLKFDSQSNVTVTLALKKIVPSTNIHASFKLRDFEYPKIITTLTSTETIPSKQAVASFRLPDFKSGKLQVHYMHRHATLASTIALNRALTLDVSATFGTPTFVMGAKASYDSSLSKFTNFVVGINVNTPNTTGSIVLGEKGDMIRGTCMHHIDVSKKTAAAGEITRKLSTKQTSFVVGVSWAFDRRTIVKAKLNNRRKLSAALQHEIIPKSLFTLSGELDTKALHKTPKFGLGLVLRP